MTDNEIIDVEAEDNAIIPFDPTQLGDLGFDLSVFGDAGEFTETNAGGIFLPRLTIATADNKAGKDGQEVGHFILTVESGEYIDLGDWIAVMPIDEVGSRSHWYRNQKGQQLSAEDRKKFNLPAQSCGSNNGENPRKAYIGTKVTDHRNSEVVVIPRTCAECPLGKFTYIPEIHPVTGEPILDEKGQPKMKPIPPQCTEQPNFVLYLFHDDYSGLVLWQLSGIALIYGQGFTKRNKYAKTGGLIPTGQQGFGYWGNPEKSPLYAAVPNTNVKVPVRPLIIEAGLDKSGPNSGDSNKKAVWVPVFKAAERGFNADEFTALGRAKQEYKDDSIREWLSAERTPLAALPEPETPEGEAPAHPF